MGKNDSDASQTSQTSTANYDQRIANDSGLVIGQGASYVNNFPREAVDIVTLIADFTGDVINSAGNLAERSIQSQTSLSDAIVRSNRDLQSQQQLGSASLIKDIVPVLVIGALGLFMFSAFRKRG